MCNVKTQNTGLGRNEDRVSESNAKTLLIVAAVGSTLACLRLLSRGAGWCGQARKGVWGMSWHQEAQGRGRLRKVPGSRQTGFDPETPEPTRGTETSQYPAEEKEKSTPSVAASERGRAQTGGVTLRGSRTAFKISKPSGTAWNRRPQRVKAPYATG